MRLGFLIFAILALGLGSAQSEAASCSSFAVIKSYDAAANTVEISYEKGKLGKYFPRPEGDSQEGSRIPKGCRGKVKKTTTLVVKPTGGRLTVNRHVGHTPYSVCAPPLCRDELSFDARRARFDFATAQQLSQYWVVGTLFKCLCCPF